MLIWQHLLGWKSNYGQRPKELDLNIEIHKKKEILFEQLFWAERPVAGDVLLASNR